MTRARATIELVREVLNSKVDIAETTSGKPPIEVTWRKVKSLSFLALKGLIRKYNFPGASDILRDTPSNSTNPDDREKLRDEIMGALYGDWWERDLLRKGLL